MATDPLDVLARLQRLEDRVQRLELDRERPFLELRGPGAERVRLGRQDDGRWGLRVWSAAGALIIDTTAAP